MEYSYNSDYSFDIYEPQLYLTQSQGLPDLAAPGTLSSVGQLANSHHALHSFHGPLNSSYPSESYNLPSFSEKQNISAPSMGPPAKPRKPKAPTLRAEAWEPFKARIIELHITKDLSLPKVKEIIEEETGFIAKYVSS
jgi:hypothetical protein